MIEVDEVKEVEHRKEMLVRKLREIECEYDMINADYQRAYAEHQKNLIGLDAEKYEVNREVEDLTAWLEKNKK